MIRTINALLHAVGLDASSIGLLLLSLSTIAGAKISNPSWVNFQSAGWVSFQSAPTRNVITCSGGLAGLDMILHLIALKHGEVLANDVAEQCIHPNIRPAHEKQRMKLQLRYHASHPCLLQAIELMRENVEEILSCQEISDYVGISNRQMERLFRQHLGVSPTTYYMNLRLERASQLLQQTALSILQVGTACGFVSTSYFSRCYRKRYGYTPRDERRTRDSH